MTINKSRGRIVSRIGLDLRSSAFAHGQLYVALSCAQKKSSIMCVLPPSQVVNGVPYTDNIVFSFHRIAFHARGFYLPGYVGRGLI